MLTVSLSPTTTQKRTFLSVPDLAFFLSSRQKVTKPITKPQTIDPVSPCLRLLLGALRADDCHCLGLPSTWNAPFIYLHLDRLFLFPTLICPPLPLPTPLLYRLEGSRHGYAGGEWRSGLFFFSHHNLIRVFALLCQVVFLINLESESTMNFRR